MAQKSIKKNYIYNLAYQVLLILTPLITTPYVSRILEADGVGTISYAESIVSYFVLFATLGITIFGQREISYVQDDKEKVTAIFWETKTLQLFTSVGALLIYMIFAVQQKNSLLYLVFSFSILAVLVDAVWLMQGMEEFGKVVARNFIFKAIGVSYIFLAVKTKDDLIKYVFGYAFFQFLSNLSLWIYVPRFVNRPKLREIKPFRNIKAVVALFIPTIAVQVYTVLDKTMIGFITKDAFENGYYEQAIKISKLVMMVVTALGTVMIPRIGYHFGRGETDKVKYYMYRGYRFVWFLGVPLCFGLIGTAPNFVPWFFGDGFQKVIPLLRILSFLILAIGISNVTGMQYLVPTKREHLLTLTVVIGAVVNFLSNIVLIHYFKSMGAAVASLLAETTISLVQIFLVRNELSFLRIMLSSATYLAAGGLMLFCLHIMGMKLSPSVVHTAMMIATGAGVYFAALLAMRDSFFVENLVGMYEKVKMRMGKGEVK